MIADVRPLEMLTSPSILRTLGMLIGFAVALGVVLRMWARLRRTMVVEGVGPAVAGTVPAPAVEGATRPDGACATVRPDKEAAGLAAGRPDGQAGHAVTEFALVMPVGMMLLLLLVQTALMLQANLYVHYAAFCGARAAVVWIPRPMENLVPELADVAMESGRSDGPNNISSDGVDSPKTLRIQMAAAYACWPIAGALDADTSATVLASKPWAANVVAQAWSVMYPQPGGPPVLDRYTSQGLLDKYLYAITATRVRTVAVTPLAQPRPERGHFGQDMQVRIDVEHDFALQLPFAGRILGRRLTSLGSDNIGLPSDRPIYVTTLTADAMFSNEGRGEYPGLLGR